MKKILILLLLYSNLTLFAEEDCGDNCMAELSPREDERDESMEEKVERISNQLKEVVEQFEIYKIEKEKEIKTLKQELTIIKNQLSQIDDIEMISTENSSLTWVEVEVSNGMDIYELALKYYGDEEKYRDIYLANKNIIDEELNIEDGMVLRIPIIEDFEEQPIFINLD